jgi:oxygen-independent coproporphyrinogen-3 oxidase
MFSKAVDQLEDAGYRYIGMDHFALPSDELSVAQDQGRLRRNFMGYTTVSGDGVLALGPSAISDFGSSMLQNSPSLEHYGAAVRQQTFPIEKFLVRSLEDQIRSAMIESVLCGCSVSLKTLFLRFPSASELIQKIFSDAKAKLLPHEGDGLVWLSEQSISVQQKGRFFLRNIAACFDSYLDSKTSQKRFSQAI